METSRVLVAYGSKHGATGEIAQWVADTLRGDGLTVDVRDAGTFIDVAPYDAVIIGGALYAMRWHADARRFVRHHRHELASRRVWLFSSGPLDWSAEYKDIRPVRSAARAAARVGAEGHITFGGFISTDTPGRMAKAIAKKSDGDYRDRDQIEQWAHGIAGSLRQPVMN